LLINLRSDDGEVGGAARDRSTTVPINTIRQILLYAPYDGPDSQFRCPIVTLEFLVLPIGLVEASHLRKLSGAYGAGPSSALLHLAVSGSLLVPLCSGSILSLRIRADPRRGQTSFLPSISGKFAVTNYSERRAQEVSVPPSKMCSFMADPASTEAHHCHLPACISTSHHKHPCATS
jgi:hypothetical protein